MRCFHLMSPRRLRLLMVLLPLGSTACVETGIYEKAVSQLEEAKHAAARKDEEIRAYQWQAAALTQQLREAQARTEALQRDLFTQLQQLTVSNASLTERLKKVESERAALALAASEPPPATRDGKPVPGLRPEDLRRMIAATDARNAQIVEELARIERLLGAPPLPGRGHPQPPGRPGRRRGRSVGLRLAQVAPRPVAVVPG